MCCYNRSIQCIWTIYAINANFLLGRVRLFHTCTHYTQGGQQQWKWKKENYFQVAWKKRYELMDIVDIFIDPFQWTKSHEGKCRLKSISLQSVNILNEKTQLDVIVCWRYTSKLWKTAISIAQRPLLMNNPLLKNKCQCCCFAALISWIMSNRLSKL